MKNEEPAASGNGTPPFSILHSTFFISLSGTSSSRRKENLMPKAHLYQKPT
jgi:hypothetical protein